MADERHNAMSNDLTHPQGTWYLQWEFTQTLNASERHHGSMQPIKSFPIRHLSDQVTQA